MTARGRFGLLGKLLGGKGKPSKGGRRGGIKPIHLYLLLGGGILSLWQNWLSPKVEEVSLLRQNLEVLAEGNLPSLQERYAFLQREVESLEGEIRKEVGRDFSNPTEVLALLYRASLRAGLDALAYEGMEEQREEGSPLRQTVFSLSGTGSYPRVAQFLQLLGEEGLRVGGLSLTPTREGETPKISFRVQVILYSFTPLSPR